MGRQIAAGFKVAIPLNLEATDGARSPETPDRYRCAVWRDFRFFGTEPKNLVDHVTFPGQGREDVDTQTAGDIAGLLARFSELQRKAAVRTGKIPSHCHSRSRPGRVLDSSRTAARGDREPCGRSGLNRSTAPAAASQDRQDRWGGVAAGAFGL